MSASEDALARIAAALERLAPSRSGSVDWGTAPGFIWDGESAQAIGELDALPLDRLRAVEQQKAAAHQNLTRLAKGAAAHDMLLWGARGMGKSALIRACVADLEREHPGRLALIQIMPGALTSVPALFDPLSRENRSFVLFIDDLGFGADQQPDILALRSVLDGGLMARPANVRLAVTTNQRSIVARRADGENEALHERDARDDALALADRFGLTLAFHPCDRADYLEILRSHTEPLGLAFDEEEALAWAIARGNRSGRTAYQFAVELAGRAGIAL